MYKDHKKGFNEELSNIAKSALLLKRLNKVKTIVERQFDEYGDVIRNYREELEAYVKDEEENLLPQVTSDYFNSFQRAALHREKHAGMEYDVKVVPQLPRQKVVPKPQPLYQKTMTLLKAPYPRIAYALRLFF